MSKLQRIKSLTLLLLLAGFIHCALPSAVYCEGSNATHKLSMDEADLDNGKAIYERGRHAKGESIPFTGGPHWIRTQDTGCRSCHGPKGMGGIQPNLCIATSPPITCSALRERAYTVTCIKDWDNPLNSEVSLINAIRTGIKPDGFEMDFCMPRWSFSNEDFRDLLGYIHALKDKE